MERWIVGQENSWTGEYADRVSAIHAGDDLFKGEPFFIARRVGFQEWLRLCWMPVDILCDEFYYSEAESKRTDKSFMSGQDACKINDTCCDVVVNVLEASNSIPDAVLLVDTEQIVRLVPRAPTSEEA